MDHSSGPINLTIIDELMNDAAKRKKITHKLKK